MRLLLVPATVAERDAVLRGQGPATLARLAPYADTRVAHPGAGTLIVVPAGGPGVAAAAAAAAVGLNRLAPDLVVSVGLAPTGPVVADRILAPDGRAYDVPPAYVDLLAERAGPAVPVGPVDAEPAYGVAVAAAAHGAPVAAVLGADLDGLAALAAALFARPWVATGN